MKQTAYKKQSIKHINKDSWVKMHVVQAMTLMFMFTQALEHIFVVNKQV